MAKGVKLSGHVERTSWLETFLLAWLLPIGLLAAIWFSLMRRLQGGRGGPLSIGRNKARICDASQAGRVTFEDVAGVDEAEAELVEVVDFLKNPQKYTAIGARIPTGVLLVGPPGTGKTLLAKAVAGEAGVPFFSLSGSEFVEMFVGLGAARMRDLFEEARTCAPCIVSSTSSTRSASRAEASRHSRLTTSVSRRSTSYSSRWTVSRRPPASSSWPPPTARRCSTRPCCARAASTVRLWWTGPTWAAARTS
jgi:hypothetical protein